MSSGQARIKLAEVIGRARFAGGRTIITSRGLAVCAVVSLKDLARIEERAP